MPTGPSIKPRKRQRNEEWGAGPAFRGPASSAQSRYAPALFRARRCQWWPLKIGGVDGKIFHKRAERGDALRLFATVYFRCSDRPSCCRASHETGGGRVDRAAHGDESSLRLPQRNGYRALNRKPKKRDGSTIRFDTSASRSLASNSEVRKFTLRKLRKISRLQLRTKFAQSRASESLAERERISGLRPGSAVQRFWRKQAPNLGFLRANASQENITRNKFWRCAGDCGRTFSE